MPRGDKSTYTDKQKRQAKHIKEGYVERGLGADQAEDRAWATVNKMTGSGKNPVEVLVGEKRTINMQPGKEGETQA